MQENSDLAQRIKNVQDKISLGRSSEAAAVHRSISSSIGTETPVGILSEIREGQMRILDEMKEILLTQRETEIRNQERHAEMCSILVTIAEAGAGTRSSPPSSSTIQQQNPSYTLKQGTFYGSSRITNGTYLVACIFVHMDAMLQTNTLFKKIQSTDTTHMTIADWFNLCSAALNADKDSKAGLRVPRPADEDFAAAARVVASPVVGRRPVCDSTHIALLLSQCPALMNTVEWLRGALIKCSGVLSPERTCRFRLFCHPFVKDTGELSLGRVETLKMPNRFMHRDVSAMKASKKKEYMRLVLHGGLKPMDAISRVKVEESHGE